MSNVYKMTVGLDVLEHLGINLYSNVAAVLAEAVTNAWDADAATVDITIDKGKKRIEIADDGIGMSVEDMNNKYLRVGYQRRKHDKKITARKRKVMGRKGLGKLSLFSIADEIEIQSVHKGGSAHGLRMTVEGIRESAKRHEPEYRPEPLSPDELDCDQGTRIVLRKVRRERFGIGVAALRKRLARRFSFDSIGDDFKISIDGAPITVKDRVDSKIVQFLWHFGDFDPKESDFPELKEREKLEERCTDWGDDRRVSGWIGTVTQPKQLDAKDAGNLNGIVVFARGRLVHENILEKVNDGRLYTKYLTGQLEVDFLDKDDEPDIATSDRQRLQEDDPRYQQLLSFLKARLSQVESRWTSWRRKHQVSKAGKDTPAIGEWLGTLHGGLRRSAEELIGKLGALPVDDAEDQRTLYRHGIYAFERMRLREETEKLAAGVDDINKLLPLLADRDDLEASLYHDIVRSRLEAVTKFQSYVDMNALERVLQKYLFDHLWLLDPAWERATDSPRMESRLRKEGVIVDDLTEKEKLGRVDIAYRTNAGKHIIVELKRAERSIPILDLVAQGRKYVSKLKKIALSQGDPSPNIEVVFVLGKPLREETEDPDGLKNLMNSVSPGSRVVYYEHLIKGAREAYFKYLEKDEHLNRVDAIVNRI